MDNINYAMLNREGEGKTMKKRLISLLVMSSLLLGVTACSGSDDTSNTENESGKITFTFSEHVADIEEQAPQVYAVVQEFMKQNPDIKIELTGEAQDEHTQKIKLASQSDTLPDLFYSLKGDADTMAEAGLLADISEDIMDDQEFVDGFLPGMLDVMEKDGAIYGLPAEIFCNGIWYNKALFDKYGLEIPVTYDDLLHCAEIGRAHV